MSSGIKKVVVNHNLQSKFKFINAKQAEAAGELVEFEQLNNALALKQNNLTGGNGIKIESDVISLDIGSTGTDHNSVTISGIGAASLNGEYTLAPFKGHLDQIGSYFDLVYGGNHNVYVKEVTPSSWALLIALESGGNYYWHAAVTTQDPSNITQNISQLFPPFNTIDASPVTTVSEQDENNNFSPSSDSSSVTYSVGTNPGGLIIQNGKAVVDFANAISEVASNKVFASSVIKQYVDAQDTHFKDSSNQVFSNAVAQLTGNPSNPQTAIEAIKTLIDALSATVTSNQSTAAIEYVNIDSLRSALGSNLQHMGITHDSLSNNTSAKGLINELAALIATLRADANTTLGIADVGGTLSGVGGSVPDGLDVKDVISHLANESADLMSDQFTRIAAAHFYHLSVGANALTADQLAGTEAFNIASYVLNDDLGNEIGNESIDISGLLYDARILVDYGSGGNVNAGVYIRDKDTGFLSRATYFDESDEILKGTHMKIVNGGVIAGSDFVVVNANNPVIGVDPIEFAVDDFLYIGNGVITKEKLNDSLQNEIDAKNVKEIVEDGAGSGIADLTAGVGKVISHSLGRCMVSIVDANGNDISAQVEIDHNNPTFNQVTITSGDDYTGVYITLFG